MNIIEEYSNLSQSNFLTGRVVINQETCTGCKQCEIICPASCLEIVDKKARMMQDRDCISCGACISVCKDDCIRMSNFWKVPDGGFQTLAKQQTTGQDSFPRFF